ncbi:hypothetical protein PENSPDRAFT_750424, partial [Peniophora sp. CONT]
MPLPDMLAYQYKKKSVIAKGATSHAVRTQLPFSLCSWSEFAQEALEIAHREFLELRDVEDERIHFSMFVKRHATGVDPRWDTLTRSRISPGIWESFWKRGETNVDKGMTVMFVEVNELKKISWAERLGLGKERQRPENHG